MDDGRYTVFTRTWWAANPGYPDGREPRAGRKRTLARNLSYAEARHIASEWNSRHKPGKLSRKAEITQQ
jgi:hypothetical protein